MNIAELFEEKSCGIGYVPHKTFHGVSLKHLVTGGATGGDISYHLVKVEPFCSLETHAHPAQVEVHAVLSGSGEALVANRQTRYGPGTVAVIPKNAPHRVTAGGEGLFILATFSPALC